MNIFNRQAAPLDGEQGIPVVTEERFTPIKKYAAITVCVLVAGGFAYLAVMPGNAKTQTAEAQQMGGSYLPDIKFETLPTVQDEAEKAEEPETAAAAPEAEAAPETETEPTVIVETQVVTRWRDRPEPAIPSIHKGRSMGMVVATAGQAGAGATSGQPPATQVGYSSTDGSAGSTGSAQAVKLDNLDTTILAGQLIPCALNQDINTQFGGDIGCTVLRDVWAEDSSQILIQRGSQVAGTYAAETTSAAVTRIGAIWGRLVTTDKIAVDLGSYGADEHGAVGMQADNINRHFGVRFGSAFAVSLIEGALGSISSTGDTTSDVVINAAAGSNASSMATEVFRETVGIPTTRETFRGSEITIYLRNDLHFKGIL